MRLTGSGEDEKLHLRRALLLATALVVGCSDERPEHDPAQYVYALDAPSVCEQAQLTGAAGGVDDLELVPGTRVNLRTPANYRADLPHPLLVVYAPAMQSAAASERFAGLTRSATARGFIVAYVASRRLSLRTLPLLTRIPRAIADRWCVDEDRMYALGHSDGGTVSVASLLLAGSEFEPRAIVASAAGFSAEDLNAMKCPPQRPALFVQMRNDRLFPGYVAELAHWWARCNGCAAKTGGTTGDCRAWQTCPAGGETLLCEVEGPHTRWPGINDVVLDFLEASVQAAP